MTPRPRILPAVLALCLCAGQGTFAHDEQAEALAYGIDLKHLPLGDTRISDAPKKGAIWACRIDTFAPTMPNGPWIGADGTYDLTAKPTVQGAVTWPHKFVMAVKGEQRLFTSNNLPAHPTGTFPIAHSDPAYRYDRNPNGIAQQDMAIALPLNPVMAARPSCTPGAVGILLTGVALFSALDAAGHDAVAHEVQDSCQGHPQLTGTYHYHSLTTCFDDKQAADGHSELAGYALDGFGIYGHHGEGGKVLTSADLDECHGHTHKILWNGKMVEMYHYHATWDFPYTVGCLHGGIDFRNLRVIGGAPVGARGGPPDLAGAAAKLGVSPEVLRAALGPPPPDFKAAAAKLGVSEEVLRAAMGPPPTGFPGRRPPDAGPPGAGAPGP